MRARVAVQGRPVRLSLWPVILLALGLRLYGLTWDGGYLFHPDERFVLSVAEQVRDWPREGFSLGRFSPLNPFWNSAQATARHFPYGHLTVYLATLVEPLAGSFARWVGLDPLVVGARLLAALADTLAVWITYEVGRTVGGPKGGWLAAALLAGTVLHVQYAHFYTADTLLTPVLLAALLMMVRLAAETSSSISFRKPLVAGILVGLAAGIKAPGWLLLLPLFVAHLLAGPAAAPETWRQWWRRPAWGWFGLSVLAAGLAFAITNPYALLDWPHFLRSLAAEAGMVRGKWVAPFTYQYLGTSPYLYPFAQHVRWFLGLVPALVAWSGVLAALVRAAQGRATRQELVILAWCVPFILLVGGLFAKFPRYWLAAVPAMYVLGSRALLELGRWSRPARFVAGAAVANALVWAVAFSRIYAQPHPWVQASLWLYEHVPPGAVLAVERWDHPLPVPLSGKREGHFRQIEHDGYDTGKGSEELEQVLDQADYVVLSSTRVWVPLLRYPQGHEVQAAFYRRLLAEEAGFRVVKVWRVEPQLGPISFRDNPFARVGLPTPAAWFTAAPAPATLSFGPADEGFEVYDHPLVIVLERETRR